MSVRRVFQATMERSAFCTMFGTILPGLAIIPALFGLLIGVALAASSPTAGAPVGAPSLVAAAMPASAGAITLTAPPSETRVDEIVRELQSIKTVSKWEIAVIGLAGVGIAVLVALLLLRYARVADRMKLGFGFSSSR